MREFDDEPGTGGGYERAIAIRLETEDGIPRRIVIRFRGRPIERISISLDEVRNGIRGTLMRYDDAHGFFHRHVPGWPEPPGEYAQRLEAVPTKMRAAFAIEEIKKSYAAWEEEIFGRRGEQR